MATSTLPADNLPAKVVAYFLANPEEALTTEDIAAKFSVPMRGIHSQLLAAMDTKALQRNRNEDGGYTYRAGPATRAALRTPGTQAPADAQAITPDTVRIHKGIPVPPARNVGQDWGALLQRMEVGDCTDALPRRLLTPVRKHMTQANKKRGKTMYVARFVVESCTEPSTHFRVWRTAM